MVEVTVSSETIYRGRVVTLRVDTVQLPNGTITKREIVEHSGAVGIVAVDTQDNILLVRQFRKAVERELLEIPAGGIDPGESIEDAVRRELHEETGYIPSIIEPLTGFYSSAGFCTEYMHVYLATGLRLAEAAPEEDEIIATQWVPFREALAMVERGEICDAKSVAGLYALWYRRTAGAQRR
jgi:ADP-ribose pyrophosphatase